MIIEAKDPQIMAEVIAAAAADGRRLGLQGGGSKIGLGQPMTVDDQLDLSGWRGITSYEPEELVLSARAGTPLADIEVALAAQQQHLAFEPRNLSGLLEGGRVQDQTLGGVVATNLAGPRRCTAGAVRDHVLGLSAINGRGEIFKAGGRVVKNVTGYDLCKLLTGSFGTLAALTEITLKVLPASETEETLVIAALDVSKAVQQMAEALGGSAAPSAASWLDGKIFLRLEGFGPSVRARRQKLTDRFGAAEVLEDAASRDCWQAIRDVKPFHGRPGQAVWKLSIRPSDAPALLGRLSELEEARTFLDWGGALVWLSLPAERDAKAGTIRQMLPPGGQGWLVAAPLAVRAAVPVFPPLLPALAALQTRVKASFDPGFILNPGRMGF